MEPAERLIEEPRGILARSRRWRLAWMAVAAMAAIFLAAIAIRVTRAPADPRYDTVRVDRGRIVAHVTATGTLSALVTVQVGSQVSGRIQKLYADFNTQVRKGQLIAKIDPQLFQAALEQARANHASAKGELARSGIQAADSARQRDRARSLAERKLIAQADLDTAQANADAAQAAVEVAEGKAELARAALRQAEVNLAYTNIISPIDGIIISRSVDVGQTVAASLQAPTLFVIAEDLRKMQVDTSVSEADIGKLKTGMEAYFSVDSFPGKRFKGTIRQIRNAPQTIQNVVTYDAVVDVANPDLELRPGMTANVSFVHAERGDVLRVPNAALRFRPSPEMARKLNGQGAAPAQNGQREPNQRTVWILRGTPPAPIPVTIRTGVSDGSTTEVLEGDLREGDLAITDAGDERSRGGGPPPGPGTMRRIL